MYTVQIHSDSSDLNALASSYPQLQDSGICLVNPSFTLKSHDSRDSVRPLFCLPLIIYSGKNAYNVKAAVSTTFSLASKSVEIKSTHSSAQRSPLSPELFGSQEGTCTSLLACSAVPGSSSSWFC